MGSEITPRDLKGFAKLEDSKMLVIMDIDAITYKDEL